MPVDWNILERWAPTLDGESQHRTEESLTEKKKKKASPQKSL